MSQAPSPARASALAALFNQTLPIATESGNPLPAPAYQSSRSHHDYLVELCLKTGAHSCNEKLGAAKCPAFNAFKICASARPVCPLQRNAVATAHDFRFILFDTINKLTALNRPACTQYTVTRFAVFRAAVELTVHVKNAHNERVVLLQDKWRTSLIRQALTDGGEVSVHRAAMFAVGLLSVSHVVGNVVANVIRDAYSNYPSISLLRSLFCVLGSPFYLKLAADWWKSYSGPYQHIPRTNEDAVATYAEGVDAYLQYIWSTTESVPSIFSCKMHNSNDELMCFEQDLRTISPDCMLAVTWPDGR